MFAEAEYQSARVQLDPGDFLVIYTDGVSEASNMMNELFEEARLRMIIENFCGENVHQLGDAIREGMRVFTEGAAQSDDITILVHRVQGQPRMTPRKTTPRTPATLKAEGLPLETLEQVVATLNPETDPGELAAQMVCVLAAPGRFEGARLWRVVNGTPVVWQESGELRPRRRGHGRKNPAR